jgi:hypothetical protein
MNSTGGGRARCLRVEDVSCHVLAVEVPEELGAFGDAGSKPRVPSLASEGGQLQQLLAGLLQRLHGNFAQDLEPVACKGASLGACSTISSPTVWTRMQTEPSLQMTDRPS